MENQVSNVGNNVRKNVRKKVKMQAFKGNLMLFMAAFIWGTAFVAQSAGMEFIGHFTFNAIRNYIAFIVLIPLIFIIHRISGNQGTVHKNSSSKKDVIKAGICCGCMLFLASSFQQIGIKYTSVGKAGFITTFYVIIIPLLGLFMGKRIGLKIVISLIAAVLGLYLLCMSGGLESISKGDFYILLCAFCNAFHILTVDHFSPKVDGAVLSCIQFLVCALISTIPMIYIEMPAIADILKSMGPILYAAVLSSGVAYTLQIFGQRYTEPVIASLLMSLESVFSVLAGWVVLHQVLSFKETLGCIIVFAAVTLAQMPESKIKILKRNKIKKISA